MKYLIRLSFLKPIFIVQLIDIATTIRRGPGFFTGGRENWDQSREATFLRKFIDVPRWAWFRNVRFSSGFIGWKRSPWEIIDRRVRPGWKKAICLHWNGRRGACPQLRSANRYGAASDAGSAHGRIAW